MIIVTGKPFSALSRATSLPADAFFPVVNPNLISSQKNLVIPLDTLIKIFQEENVVLTTGDQNISGQKYFHNAALFLSGIFSDVDGGGRRFWSINKYGYATIGLSGFDDYFSFTPYRVAGGSDQGETWSVANNDGTATFPNIFSNFISMGDTNTDEFVVMGSNGSISGRNIFAGDTLDVNGVINGTEGHFEYGLTIAGAPVTTGGPYYLNSNPSGYITAAQTVAFVTTGQTGVFYPRSNPSGFITSGQTGVFANASQLGGYSGSYYRDYANMTGIISGTGSFVTTGQTGNFASASKVVYTTGNQTISGIKTFNSETTYATGNFFSNRLYVGTGANVITGFNGTALPFFVNHTGALGQTDVEIFRIDTPLAYNPTFTVGNTDQIGGLYQGGYLSFDRPNTQFRMGVHGSPWGIKVDQYGNIIADGGVSFIKAKQICNLLDNDGFGIADNVPVVDLEGKVLNTVYNDGMGAINAVPSLDWNNKELRADLAGSSATVLNWKTLTLTRDSSNDIDWSADNFLMGKAQGAANLNFVLSDTSDSFVCRTYGKFGIGYDTPVYNLDVKGSGNFSSGAYDNGSRLATTGWVGSGYLNKTGDSSLSFKDGAFRIVSGALQIYDFGYNAWVRIGCNNGILTVSDPL